jgi:hypothetical protein
VVALGLGAAACGGTSKGPFGWLRPQAPPSGWLTIRIPTGAALSYPPGWRIVHGDSGTATAALVDARGRYLGYLNVTPRQGEETLGRWASFRTAHNVEEGDHAVKRLAAATNLRFRTGRGSCVKDSYSTEVQTRYIEIACLVAGRTASTVIVGASPPSSWPRTSATLERAIEGFTT